MGRFMWELEYYEWEATLQGGQLLRPVAKTNQETWESGADVIEAHFGPEHNPLQIHVHAHTELNNKAVS